MFCYEKSKSLPAVYAFWTVMNKECYQKQQRLNTKNALVIVRYKTGASTIPSPPKKMKKKRVVMILPSYPLGFSRV